MVPVVVCLLVAAACHHHDEDNSITPEPIPGGIAHRTVLLYMVGENSLAPYLASDLNELAQGALSLSSKDVMLVYLDGIKLPRLFRYYVKGGQVYCDTVKKYNSDVISTDTTVMSSILHDAFNAYPAQGYGLIMWSHGNGWLYDSSRSSAAAIARRRTIGIDNGRNTMSNTGQAMEIEELASVLGKLDKPLDFLFFDACFMQGAEVAYALRNCTRYIVGSPAEIPGPGAPYQKMVTPMFADSADIAGMVDAYYSYYNDNEIKEGYTRYGALVSAVKCDEMENLAQASRPLIIKYLHLGHDLDLNIAQRYLPILTSAFPEYFDMNGVVSCVADSAEYAAWKRAYDRAVPVRKGTSWWYSNYAGYCSVDFDQYTGFSFFVPRAPSMFPTYTKLNTAFTRTAWYKAAGWDEAGW